MAEQYGNSPTENRYGTNNEGKCIGLIIKPESRRKIIVAEKYKE